LILRWWWAHDASLRPSVSGPLTVPAGLPSAPRDSHSTIRWWRAAACGEGGGHRASILTSTLLNILRENQNSKLFPLESK